MEQAEFAYEKKHLSETLDCVGREMRDLDARLTGNIQAADDQTVEALTKRYIRRLKVLILIKDNPYFARVDFTPGNGKKERLYIGKTTVPDENGDAVVVDWRAPISTLYYEGRVGPASYRCPDGTIQGEIGLKRQFDIENRRLVKYTDIDITFDDELLRPYLEVNSSMRLKNIIATIQAEQNRIIRADMFRPLIIQGVAGSGKTTVALHRIAYLIYAYAKDFKPEEFLIIAPNALFLDYIANVLPDLGVENVRQLTFETLAQELIGKKLKIEDPGEKLARILDGARQEAETSRYKSSLAFRDAIGRFLNDFEKTILPHEDFCAGKYILCSYAELTATFSNDMKRLPFETRIELIKKRLSTLLKENAERIIARIDQERRRQIANLKPGLPDEKRKTLKREIYEKDEALVHDLLSGGKNVLKTYFKKVRLPSAIECYRGLTADKSLLEKYCGKIDGSVLDMMASRAEKLAKNCVEYEDLAPLMHIRYRICGKSRAFLIRHIVIDEAQDLSAFQFFAVKEALECGSLSIFGDIAQGIYGYRGTSDWAAVKDEIFGGNCDYAVLSKSYRSTVEIMEQANRIQQKIPGLQKLEKAQPVIRHGEPVRFFQKDNEDKIAGDIAERIRELQAGGMKNIAVICKTARGCRKFARKLKKYIPDFHIINGKEYAGGLSIVASHMVKGLEFDAALIADAQLYGENELDLKLLYVAMTRAMHRMELYCAGPCAIIGDKKRDCPD